MLYHRFGGSHVSEECCLIDEVQKEIVMLRLCTYDAISQCHFSGLEIYVWRIFLLYMSLRIRVQYSISHYTTTMSIIKVPVLFSMQTFYLTEKKDVCSFLFNNEKKLAFTLLYHYFLLFWRLLPHLGPP